MKCTNFFRLRQAIQDLDVHFIARKIGDLEGHLTSHGQALEPQHTAITEDGVYFISPDSGMATKVVVYQSDHAMTLTTKAERTVYVDGYLEPGVVAKLNMYHILRCNVLTQAEYQGKLGSYRIAQRPDGFFYYRIVKENTAIITDADIYQEIENQKLFVCPNCLIKAKSLIEGVEDVDRELFELKYFFDVDFTGTWCRYEESAREAGSMANIYPKDWALISRIRKEQVDYLCESCELDLSDPYFREFLYVHPTDHFKRRVGYVRLRCLCLGCLAEQPNREYLKEMPEYAEYLRALYRGRPKRPVRRREDA